MNKANFDATLVDFKVNGKKTVLKLELTNSDAARNFGFLVSSLDKDVQVWLGDMQVSMEDFGVTAPAPFGRPYNVQKDGTVNVKQPEGEQEEMELEGGTNKEEEQPEEEEADEAEHSEDASEESDGMDLDFDEDEAAEDQTADEVEPKDEVEAWILNGNSFGDEEQDWETLLRRKKSGETWMKIASSIHTSSTKLSAAWRTYKKRVKEYLAGEEHGAA